VGGKVVHHDGVSAPERWTRTLLKVCRKHFSIIALGSALAAPFRHDADPRRMSRSANVQVEHGHITRSLRGPRPFGRTMVEEPLFSNPASTRPSDISSPLLRGLFDDDAIASHETPKRGPTSTDLFSCASAETISSNVRSDCSAAKARIHSECRAALDQNSSPLASCCTHLTTELALISNCSFALRRNAEAVCPAALESQRVRRTF
jgi:hypothetical protein